MYRESESEDESEIEDAMAPVLADHNGVASDEEPSDDGDGDLEDVWGIVQRVHAEGFFGRGYEIFICIDWQSSLDRTVLLVVPQYWDPGKRWSRVSR